MYPSLDELLASQPDLSLFRELLKQLNMTTLWGDDCAWSGVKEGQTAEDFVQLPNDTCIINGTIPTCNCSTCVVNITQYNTQSQVEPAAKNKQASSLGCGGNAAGTYAFEEYMGTMALPTDNVSVGKCTVLHAS
jgi:hypothetical protein